MQNTHLALRRAGLIVFACSCWLGNGLAQTWNVDANGYWTNAANWTPATVPSNIDAIATFGNVILADRIVTNNVVIRIGTINFDSANNYTITNTGTGRFVFDVSSGNAQILVSNVNGNASDTIYVPITLNDPLVISNLSSGVLTFGGNITNGGNLVTIGGSGDTIINGIITGSGSLTKNDGGTLQLRGGNNYSGGTLVSGGILMGGNTTLQGNITNNATVVFNAAGNGTYAGILSGSGDVIISNTAGISTTFTGDNTYSGSTIVNQGKLSFGAGGSISNGSDVIVNTGTFSVDGGSVTVGRITATNAGTAFTPNFGSVTTLQGVATAGAVTLGSASGNANWFVGGGTNVIGGNLQVGTGSATLFGRLVVSGPGTVWTNNGTALVGAANNGCNSSLVIGNGAKMYQATAGGVGLVGNATGAPVVPTNNVITITGDNSLWDLGGGSFVFCGNLSGGSIGAGSAGANNYLYVINGGTLSNVAGIRVAQNTFQHDNYMVISNGGKVYSTSAFIGGAHEFVVVDGVGSLWTNNGTITMGLGNPTGNENSLLISGGGTVYAAGLNVGFTGTSGVSTNNNLTVDGTGSLLIDKGALNIGGNAYGNKAYVINGGQITIIPGNSIVLSSVNAANAHDNGLLATNGGIVEANSYVVGGSLSTGNTVSNIGGIYQFTTTNMGITLGAGAGNAMMISNGWISFRSVSNANVFGNFAGSQLTKIAFGGDNTFRLDSASNRADIAQSYVFDIGRGPTNYYALELINGSPLWRSSTLTVGSGGHLLVSNAVAMVQAAFVSTGAIEVAQSTVTFANNVTIVGSYKSDPSTNIFNSNVVVEVSGTLAGGVGDRFEFQKSLFIHSTNNIGFNLASSSVAFTTGGMHTNAITGADLGSNLVAYAAAFEAQTNFAYGELHLGTNTDQICFTCGILPAPGVTNNALYVGWLDLLGNTSLVTNLHAANGINIYYNATDPRNAYLGGLSQQLTDCNFATGGGWLYPIIPEPSTLGLMTLAALSLLARRNQNRE